MTQEVTFDLFFVSLAVLLLVLMVLLLLCWIIRRNRGRNLTELQVSAGRPARILIVRTEPDRAQQLLDHLLDRVFLQMESGPESGGEPGAETGEELGGESESDSGSDPGVSTAASLPSKAVHALRDKMWKWIAFANPPPATPRPSPPRLSPTNRDQTKDLGPHQSGESQYASLSPQGASCSACWEEEEKNFEFQL